MAEEQVPENCKLVKPSVLETGFTSFKVSGTCTSCDQTATFVHCDCFRITETVGGWNLTMCFTKVCYMLTTIIVNNIPGLC